MSYSCQVNGCQSITSPESPVYYFRFPIQNQKLLNKWLASGLDIENISQYSRICSQHFSPDDYYVGFRGKILLKPHAVPNMIEEIEPVPYDPETMQLVDSFDAEMEDENKSPITEENELLRMNGTFELPIRRSLDVASQTETRFLGVTEREKKLQRKVIALKSRVKKLWTKIKNAENLMLHLNQTEKCINAIENGPLTGVSEFNLEILKNEQYNQGLSNNHKTYTTGIKEFSWTLFNYSPEAYEFVRSNINLPNIDILLKWRNSLARENV